MTIELKVGLKNDGQIVTQAKKLQEVTCLVCTQHVDMALLCLGSMLRFCDSPLRLRIHDDGSLSEEDCTKLTSLGEVRIVRRPEADEATTECLKNYPRCLELRKELPLALKLFDTVVLSGSGEYAFVDSDVLFVRNFVNPFKLENFSADAVFMSDRENSYSIRSWTKLVIPRLTLAAKVNTGMVLFRKACFDLDLIEWFLSLPGARAIPSMREQTAWALLASRCKSKLFDSRQVRVMRANESKEELVAGHFTARTRSLLNDYAQQSMQVNANAREVEIRAVEAGACRASDLAQFEFRRLATKVTGR